MAKQTAWYRRLVTLAELSGDHAQQDIAKTFGVSKSTTPRSSCTTPTTTRHSCLWYRTD
jgi:hypothetical protein